jgi:hypothetical protein
MCWFSWYTSFYNCFKRIPAIGFEKFLTIDFTDTAIPPTVTTCALSITFSSSMSNLSYVKFYKTMDRYVALVDLETLKLWVVFIIIQQSLI